MLADVLQDTVLTRPLHLKSDTRHQFVHHPTWAGSKRNVLYDVPRVSIKGWVVVDGGGLR